MSELLDCQLDWQIITGVATSVIALCALIYSIYQGKQSREHHRLSVRPKLTTWAHSQEHAKGMYAIDLINNGLGPALIKKFSIMLDGVKVPGNGIEQIDRAMNILFPGDKYLYELEYKHMGEDYAMGAKEVCQIVKIEFKGEEFPAKVHVKNKLARADLEIEYESFYGEKFTLNTADYK